MKIKNSQIFIIVLLLVIAVMTVFSIREAKTLAAGITATVRITVCGNNIKETGEQCDGTDLSGATCQSLGYTGGTLSCRSSCEYNVSACTSGGGGGASGSGSGGGSSYVAPTETRVIIKGIAYPEAEITFLSDGKVLAIKKADSLANFNFEITNITSGVYTFSLWALDKKGIKSITFSFTTNVAQNMTTTVSGVFLPPTIELSKTRIQKGENLSIYGQTAPESEIEISVESSGPIIEKTTAEKTGDWKYSLNAGTLGDGSHTVRAKAVSLSGLSSTYSHTLIFVVGGKEILTQIEKGDINTDNKVNLVDFSILLYNWGVPKNPTTDLNNDGKVNLVDFSIMLYWWTG